MFTDTEVVSLVNLVKMRLGVFSFLLATTRPERTRSEHFTKNQTFSDTRCLDTFKDVYLHPSSVLFNVDPELGHLKFSSMLVSL